MDTETRRIVESLGQAMRAGATRSNLVEELVDGGWDAQTAQNACEIAQRWRVGQGDDGFQSWFWAIVTNKTYEARGAGWLWLIAILSFIAALPLTLAFVQSLPSGRYPVVLLALPALAIGLVGAQILGYGLFLWLTREAEKAQ